MRRQIVASAQALGKRFHYDEAHAHNVASLSVRLFDSTAEEHGMKRHERLLLETAAFLHDIGTYIRSSGHHRHGEYIVSNSEIFGLNRSDINIISNVVRYHRRTPPSPAHVKLHLLAPRRQDNGDEVVRHTEVADAWTEIIREELHARFEKKGIA